MKKWADRARAQRDSKANQLIQWLNDTIKPGGKWSKERVIIFTEYRATQNWLQEVLATEGFSGGDRLLTMYGGMDSDQREAVKAAFQTSPEVKEKLLELYPDLVPSLASALEARMKDRVGGLEKRLNERAEKEANDITAILTELKKAIEAELDEPDYQQLQLFDDPERDQFERNKNAMRARIKEIPGEIERETEAIKSRFANPQARMFPVAVTFLVPEKLAGGGA